MRTAVQLSRDLGFQEFLVDLASNLLLTPAKYKSIFVAGGKVEKVSAATVLDASGFLGAGLKERLQEQYWLDEDEAALLDVEEGVKTLASLIREAAGKVPDLTKVRSVGIELRDAVMEAYGISGKGFRDE